MVLDYIVSYLGVIFVSLSYSTLFSNAIYVPVWERQRSLRHVLHINNLSNFAYWTAHMLYEYAWSMVLIVLTVILTYIMYALRHGPIVASQRLRTPLGCSLQR